MFKSICFVSRCLYTSHPRCFARYDKKQPSPPVYYKSRKPPSSDKNPGIDRTIKKMMDDGVITSLDEVDQDLIDDTEANFFDIHDSYNTHNEQMLLKKDKLKKDIVKQKYFDENTPNLLTWSEKEQIRFLHNKDPEEWTPERIADSFPITVEASMKILKITWKPATQNRIDRHDASVMRNWKELTDDTLDGVSSDMRKKFLKFSKRIIPPRAPSNVEETLKLQEEKTKGPFSQLLEDYRNEAEKMYKEQILPKVEQPKALKANFNSDISADEVVLSNNNQKNSNKAMTLHALRKNIINKVENNKQVTIEDKYLITPNHTQETDLSNNTRSTNQSSELDTFNNDANLPKSFKEKSKGEIELPDYTKRIRIPKKAWKSGGTYKVNDCYYDCDGTFLYRVPGMTESFGITARSEEVQSEPEQHSYKIY